MPSPRSYVPLNLLTYHIATLAKVRLERPHAHFFVLGKPRHKSKIPAQFESL